jgi:hypothetical protein
LNQEIKYKRFVGQILRKDRKNECNIDLKEEKKERKTKYNMEKNSRKAERRK